jgi:hypothetical protein
VVSRAELYVRDIAKFGSLVGNLLVKLPDGFVGGYELESLLIAISVSLLLTGPGQISIEWNILKREIFPKGRSIVRQQKEDVQRV